MLNNLFFDWYSASVDASPDYIVGMLKTVYKTSTLEPARPQNGFTHGDRLVSPSGDTLITLWYGGAQQGTRTLVFASGVHADKFAHSIRDLFPDHELVRADPAIDYDEEGAYLSLARHGLRSSRAVSVGNRFIGEAGTEFSPHTARGRSLYFGSRSSVSMIRVYEKGKKDDKTRPNWVRAEFEFKPKNIEARLYYAKASISEIVSATRLGRAFFGTLGVAVSLPSVPAGTVRVETDHERAMRALRAQYHNTIHKELALNGGDLHQLAIKLLSKPA